MRVSYAVVRNWSVAEVGGEPGPMPAASLVKPVDGHLALAVVAAAAIILVLRARRRYDPGRRATTRPDS